MYNDGQSYLESHGAQEHIVVKNPRPTELQMSEYISSNDFNPEYEQLLAIGKRRKEIQQDMAHNEVDLIDLFRPYGP